MTGFSTIPESRVHHLAEAGPIEDEPCEVPAHSLSLLQKLELAVDDLGVDLFGYLDVPGFAVEGDQRELASVRLIDHGAWQLAKRPP